MLRRLAGRVMEVGKRRAGQLELAAGLQGDRSPAPVVGKADGVVVLHDRRPARALLHAFQQRTNALSPVIGNGREIGSVEGYLFVLGAEPPGVAWLLAGGDPFHEFRPRTDGGRIGYVPRHASPHQKARSRRADISVGTP
jgi:hypothetical protein